MKKLYVYVVASYYMYLYMCCNLHYANVDHLKMKLQTIFECDLNCVLIVLHMQINAIQLVQIVGVIRAIDYFF